VIAGQTAGRSLFTITTKTGVVDGNTKQIDSVITISPAGRIIGISPTALHSYSSGGTLTRSVSLTANSAPQFLLIPSNGNSAIFNDGQAVRQVNTGNGTERWKRQVTGSVTALSMTPDGSLIIAGTEAGNLAALDGNGNGSWTYPATPENRQGAGITCSALSDKGTLLAAGTVDGRILFLNSRGNLTGSSSTREYIRYIAVSADGSVVVAASDSRVYTYFPGSSPSLPVPSPSPSSGGTVLTTTPTLLPGTTPPPVEATLTATVTELPTTYSVIRTATQSPPAFITLFVSLAVAIVIFGRRR
jgi:WD40 repeat protein